MQKAFNGDYLEPIDEFDQWEVAESKVSEPELGPQPKEQKLVMHTEETMMKRNKFQLQVVNNPEKMLNMTSDMR